MRGLDERERIDAVDALGRLGNDEARTGVMEATHDRSPDVRRFAAYALARLRGPDGQARLVKMAASDGCDLSATQPPVPLRNSWLEPGRRIDELVLYLNGSEFFKGTLRGDAEDGRHVPVGRVTLAPDCEQDRTGRRRGRSYDDATLGGSDASRSAG